MTEHVGPTFENADDRFLFLTKAQFAALGATLALLASGLSVGALILTGYRAHQSTCQSIDAVNTTLREVFRKSIATTQKELTEPKFAPFKKELEASIAQNRAWEQTLFANKAC
jgi:hypothetical protein